MVILYFFALFLCFLAYKRIKNLFTMPLPHAVCLFVGPPGSGKTTLAAYFTYLAARDNLKYVVSNVPILGSMRLDLPIDFEKYRFDDVSTVLIDEAGICYSNRRFREMSKATQEFFKLYRHHHIDSLILFSQGIDIDLTILRLCEHIFLVHRSVIPGYVSIREVYKDTAIDENTHTLADTHQYVKGGHHLVYMKKYWTMFDSYELPELPRKHWIPWGTASRYKDVSFTLDLSNLPYPEYLFNMLFTYNS